MSKVSDNNYFQIAGWMLNRLKLKGTALNVYAIIYGFSQDGESSFNGSRQYLCDFTGATKPTIDKALAELQAMDLIIKTSKKINDVIHNEYKANLEALRDFTTSKETLPPGKETLQGGSKETLPHNKDINNKEDNKSIKEEEKVKKEKSLDEVIEAQPLSIQQPLREFVKMRKAIKKPITTHGLELAVKKLHELAKTESEAVAVIEQSVMNSWQGFFALKKGRAETDWLSDLKDL